MTHSRIIFHLIQKCSESAKRASWYLFNETTSLSKSVQSSDIKCQECPGRKVDSRCKKRVCFERECFERVFFFSSEKGPRSKFPPSNANLTAKSKQNGRAWSERRYENREDEKEKRAHVSGSRGDNALVCWHSETFREGYQLIASSLQFLDSVRQNLVPVKEIQHEIIALSV